MPELKTLKKQSKEFYKSIVSIFCPILGETVYFTAHGYYHLLNKPNSRIHRSQPRNPREQYLKLINLRYVPDVIRRCEQVSGIRTVEKNIKGQPKIAQQFQLVHEVKRGVRIRVVVERVGDGKHRFVSVMPHDRKSRSNKNKKRR